MVHYFYMTGRMRYGPASPRKRYGDTPEWVDWFSHRRILEPVGYLTPAKAEDKFYAANPHGSLTQTDPPPGNPARFS